MSKLPQIKIPATYLRGGTSKGVFLRLQDLPGAAPHSGPPRAARLPGNDPRCPPAQLASTPPLSIVGVRQGDRLRRPAASLEALRLKVSALGGSGRRWWFVNGAPLGNSADQDSLNATFDREGFYELSVLDEGGQTARVEFSVVD